MKEKILSINNKKLQEILSYVKNESIFFHEGMRLISWEEILNYNEELTIENTNLIPLIDLYDNNFLVYDIEKNDFRTIYIVDEFIFNIPMPIENYIELLRKYK